MDVKRAFLYGKIKEEVYVCQPPRFEDPDFPDKVYKVEKVLYGLHQAPKAWYETLSTYLLDNGFQRGKIDKTLFIRRDKGDILLIQVYVDDIIFGSTKKSLCTEFEKMMHKRFQISSMGELTFLLGLQVKQKEDGIFISQDKYVTGILKKFSFTDVKTASTPMETQKPLLKDEDGEEVDVHLYRLMISSLMYLTSLRPDIMFAMSTRKSMFVNTRFEDPDFPDRVYKVEKALYGLHQAPKAWYETLSTYLLDNGFQRGKIDKTLFIRRDKGDILLVQVYVDDIIFGSTKKSLCTEFEKMMHKKFQMSSMGELTFFLGLQVKQKEDGIFISQDKYVTEILKKFSFTDVKTASTPMETQKPLLKDEDGEEVDVHLYRLMIGSLMYLTSSRPDIMFAVCACARYQVNPKVSHLHAVKRIFRYLKGQPKLGLWYPKDSPFDLVAYTNSDYARASLDRKSTTGVAFLAKLAESEGFKQIVDFLNAHTIKYALTVNPMIYTSCIEQFWDTVKGEGSTMPTDTQHTPTIIQPSTSQPQRKQRPRKPKRKDTEVPQLSGPTTNVADKAAYEERDDSLVRAATTASSLEAELTMVT
ncbi:uncharacterized mitochondrial protein-like protein [Tanacetum coccineum]